MASIIKVDEILDSQGNQFDGSQLGNVGKVLQVVTHQPEGGYFDTSSTAWSNTYSISITPKQIGSTLIVEWFGNYLAYNSSTGASNGQIRFINQNTQNSFSIHTLGHRQNLLHPLYDGHCFAVENTTSLSNVTYYLQAKAGDSNNNYIGSLFRLYDNNSDGHCILRIWEIGA